MRFSLKTKAAAAITIMILVTAAVIVTVQTRFIRSGLVDRASAMHAALVAGAARNLDQKLETALLALTREAQVIPAAILERPQELPAYLERQPAMLLIFDALLIFSAKVNAKLDISDYFSLIGEVYYTRNPNRTTFRDSVAGIAEPSFEKEHGLGFNLIMQARF